MKIFLLGLSLLFLSVTSNAQTCKLTLAQAPKLLGISLGMSYDDFVKLTPNNKNSGQGLGDTWQHVEFQSFSDERFKDIEDIDADFFHHRMASYGISYKAPAYRIDDIKLFAQFVSRKLNLPGQWTFQPSVSAAKLSCNGFYVGINSQYHVITIFDTKLSGQLDKLNKFPGATDKPVPKP